MGTVFTYIGVSLAVLFAAFVWWRWTSVVRGARKRDERVLDVMERVAEKLMNRREVSPSEVEEIACQAHVRPLLFLMLHDLGKTELFPERFLSVEAQAEAQLAYWLMHPNELGDPPGEIAPEAVVRWRLGDHDAAFHVLRFRINGGDWAPDDWFLGLAGPFFADDPPYIGPAGAFARAGDRAGETDPEGLVEWFVDMAERKGA